MKQHAKRKSLLAPAVAVACGLATNACGSASLASGKSVANDQVTNEELIAELRAEGPSGLARALAHFDAADSETANARWERVVDQVAAQRYATWSRLFWYTDIDRAKREATRTNRPILSLRMLGRLDEDLSCANSRLFRVVLYANKAVSAFLRDNYVLHWSSERPVPTMTIDYGDGRLIETTIAGNSAHYILDRGGFPVDVLPGLYSPEVFVRELVDAKALAAKTAAADSNARRAVIHAYHRFRGERADNRLAKTPTIAKLVGRLDEATIADAERRTIGKMAMEMPYVRAANLGKGLRKYADQNDVEALLANAGEPVALDANSRALIAALRPTTWFARARNPIEPLDEEGLSELISALETRISADTVLNEISHRAQIHLSMATYPWANFDRLNAMVYKTLFLTPRNDDWLGMSSAGVFTGLPDDGRTVSLPSRR